MTASSAGRTALDSDTTPPAPIRAIGERHFHVSGYKLAARLLRDSRLRPGTSGLVDRPADRSRHPVSRLFDEMILFHTPPRHGMIRSRLQGWFTPPAVGQLQGLIDAVCDRTIAKAGAASGPIDFVDSVARVVPLAVISELIGIPEPDRSKVEKRTDVVVQAMWHTVSDVSRADGAAVLLDRYFRQLIDARRKRTRSDLVSELLAEGSLTDDEIVANLVFLNIAATFTTGDFLGSAIIMAIRDLEFRQLLRSGEAVGACVEEALRLHPPIAHVVRNTAADVALDSVVIPADSLIDFDIAAANRDPAQFAEPDEFRPGRFPNKSLSFSLGAHYCAGWALGRAEAETLLPKFLRAFPDIRLAGDPVPKRHPFQQGFRRIPLVLTGPGAGGAVAGRADRG
jgi:cytochrome P450